MHNFPHIKMANDNFTVKVTRVRNRRIFQDSFYIRKIGKPHLCCTTIAVFMEAVMEYWYEICEWFVWFNTIQTPPWFMNT